MDSTLSLVSSFEIPFSAEDNPQIKEYTYADQYPIFIDNQKLSSLVGNVSGNANWINTSFNTKKKTPDDKNYLPLVVNPRQSIRNKFSSQEFQFSKYPSSSLNVELEKQCILADLYQNIDKIKIKEKFFPPVKVVWTHSHSKAPKEPLRSSALNMKAVINGEIGNIVCKECFETKCKCKVSDSFCEITWNQIKDKFKDRNDLYENVKRSKHIRNVTSIKSQTSKHNSMTDKIQQRRTRRRKVFSSDFNSLPNQILSVSPKKVYMKVLDEEVSFYN